MNLRYLGFHWLGLLGLCSLSSPADAAPSGYQAPAAQASQLDSAQLSPTLLISAGRIPPEIVTVRPRRYGNHPTHPALLSPGQRRKLAPGRDVLSKRR